MAEIRDGNGFRSSSGFCRALFGIHVRGGEAVPEVHLAGLFDPGDHRWVWIGSPSCTIRRVWQGEWGRRIGVVLVVVGLLVQVGLMVPHIPYYWTYYNPLLGGSQRAGETIFVGTGEGLDLAGEYLNIKPDARQLTAMAWYGPGCLSYFFEGEVILIDMDNEWSDDERADLAASDYLLVYSNQLFRDRPEYLLDSLEGIEPEKRIWLHGIEYVRIYSAVDLPAELMEVP